MNPIERGTSCEVQTMIDERQYYCMIASTILFAAHTCINFTGALI